MVGENKYWANRGGFPPDELAKYEGQYVAFSSDGTKLLASSPTEVDLGNKLDRKGLMPQEYEIEFIPPADITFFL